MKKYWAYYREMAWKMILIIFFLMICLCTFTFKKTGNP